MFRLCLSFSDEAGTFLFHSICTYRVLTLFAGSDDNTVVNSGTDFMIDLLIESLVVEGSLESAFEAAVKAEIAQEANDHPDSLLDVSNTTPLLLLAKELLRSSVDKCLSTFQVNEERSDDLKDENKTTKRSPIMNLLLKLQRLLVGSIFAVFVPYHRANTPEKGTSFDYNFVLVDVTLWDALNLINSFCKR